MFARRIAEYWLRWGLKVSFEGFEFAPLGIVKNKKPSGHDEIPVIVIGIGQIRNDNPFFARRMDHPPFPDIHPGMADMGTAIPFKKKQIPDSETTDIPIRGNQRPEFGLLPAGMGQGQGYGLIDFFHESGTIDAVISLTIAPKSVSFPQQLFGKINQKVRKAGQ
jgi:hypothetical protein